jgi:hypothetical protein
VCVCVCVCVTAHEGSSHMYDETFGPSSLLINLEESIFPRFCIRWYAIINLLTPNRALQCFHRSGNFLYIFRVANFLLQIIFEFHTILDRLDESMYGAVVWV